MKQAAPSALSKDRLRAWLRLLAVSRGIEATLRERMRAEGTTLPRFDVMSALDRAGPMRMSALSGTLRVSAGNVTGIVDALEAEGHVRRTPVPGDRRATEVALTEAGRARFDAVARLHELWVDELLSDIGEDGLALLRDRLGRTARRLEEA